MAVCVERLRKEGYLVREAHNGKAALDEVAKMRPDIIVMDVKMPEMDGLECTRLLKDQPGTRGIPIIMVSARTAAADIVAGLEAGADEYLTKPFRTTELITHVGSMARLQREREDLLRSYQLRAEQIRMLVLLLDFCRSLGSIRELQGILELVNSAVDEVSGCRRISIMLPDNVNETLSVAAFTRAYSETVETLRLGFGAGMAGRAFQARQLIVVNDVSELGGPWEDSDLLLFGSFPSLASPICGDGEIVAVLNVADRIGGGGFSPREIEYIELICSIAGPAIRAILSRKDCDDARDLTLVALARLAEQRDNDTGKHVDRVAQYALIIGNELRSVGRFHQRIDDRFLHCLRYAVPLHDIGKIAIPDAILTKPDRLTVEEIAVMRTHADVGAETLRRVMQRAPEASFLQMAVEIIQSHHEWYDGSGYPRGIAGDAIPLAAQITVLADVYDAMTTKRVYKDAVSHQEAMEVIGGSSGSQFTPDIVDTFLAREAEFQALSKETSLDSSPPVPASCV